MWRWIEVWVALGGLLMVVFLNHLELLTGPRRATTAFGDTLAAFRTEFPNPFFDKSLYGAWGGDGVLGMLLLHLAGTFGAGLFLLRLTRDRLAALAGAALYGVHPLHVALFAQGAEVGLAAAPIAFFGAGLLAYGPPPARLIGAAVAGAGVLLDPTLVMLPVFLVILRIVVPDAAPRRGAVRLTAVGTLVGAALALLAGWRAWPGDVLTEQWLPPGPPVVEPIGNLLMTLGHALGHLFWPGFSGIDYGRGAVAGTWTWADPGARWLCGFGLVAIGVAFAARPWAASERVAAATSVAPRRPRLGLVGSALIGALVLPLPALLALLHTERGFHAGALLTCGFLPGLVLAVAVSAMLRASLGPTGLRRIAAGALALAVIFSASHATFRDVPRLKTGDKALKEARKVSHVSHPLRRHYLEMLVRRNHNKLDLRNRFLAFTEAHPYDPRAWDAFGRFDWVIRRFPDAVTAWTRALAIDPDNRSYRYSLAAAQLMARQYEAAIRTARPLPDAVPEVKAVRRLAHARAGKPLPFTERDARRAAPIEGRAHGVVLAEAGRFGAALAVLDRVRKARPHDARVAAYRGWCLLELGRVDEALDTLRFDALVNEAGWLAHKVLADYYYADGPQHNRREAYHHYAYFVQYDRKHPAVPGIVKLLEQMQKGER